ncbi:hypothetical protein C0995_007666 [Termitomyces sp. Mi166|nr:hypothetical protein C0995_007666 [Termitomyces sp. Mi166\
MTPTVSSPPGELQQQNLSGDPEQQTLSGIPEQRTLSGEPEQQTLSGEPQQRTLSGEPQQRTLFDLPIPHLMNTISGGKRVPHLVLAFSFNGKEQFQCAEANNLEAESNRYQREMAALCEVRSLLPRHCRLGAIRSKELGPGIHESVAILVTSNRTPRTLEWMHDIDMLRKVQQVLGTNVCPRWARLALDY